MRNRVEVFEDDDGRIVAILSAYPLRIPADGIGCGCCRGRAGERWVLSMCRFHSHKENILEHVFFPPSALGEP